MFRIFLCFWKLVVDDMRQSVAIFSMPPVDTVTVNGNKILSFIYQVKGIYLVLKGPGSAEKCLFMASTRSESTISFHRLQSTWHLVISGIATKQTTERRCKLWLDLAKHQFVHFISNGSQSIVELFSLVHVLNHPIKQSLVLSNCIL